MYKKFFAMLFVLALGFMVGMYGRSAPDAETADFGAQNMSVSKMVKVEAATPEKEEPPAPEYTEITVTATAYCPCVKCCGKSDGITATGTKATAGRTIAVDPSIIPYGTEIIINGNTYIAEDTGGAVKGNRVDIFFNTHKEARQFGRQTLIAKVKN